MTRKKSRLFQTLFCVFLIGMVLLLFHRFSVQNSDRIKEQNRIYAVDAARQTAWRINDNFINSLDLIGRYAYFASLSLKSANISPQMLMEMEQNSPFNAVRFSNMLGLNYSSDGDTNDVSRLDFFERGMRGESGVSVVLRSAIFNQAVLGFFAPLRFDNKIIGVLRGSYWADSYLRHILKASYFGRPAEVFLCQADGSIIANSSQNVYNGNVLDILRKNGEIDPEAMKEAERILASGKDGSVAGGPDGSTANICIIRLPDFDFFLVQIFPEGVTDTMISNANRAGMQLEISLLLLSALAIAVPLIRAQLQKKALERQNHLYGAVVSGMANVFAPGYSLVDLAGDSYTQIDGLEALAQGNASRAGTYEDLINHLESTISTPEGKKNFRKFFSDGNILKALATTNHVIFECHIDKAGQDAWENVIAACVERVHGTPEQLLFLRQDVTAVKQHELRTQQKIASMDRKERQYRLAVTANAICSFEFNVTKDTLEDMRLMRRDDQRAIMPLRDIATSETASMCFERWGESILPESREEFKKMTSLEHLRQSFEAGQTEVDMDYWCTNAEGTEVCLRQAFYLTRDKFSGDIMAMTVIRDITTQVMRQRMQTKALRDALIQARHANEAKTTFLSNMSHDIRTPMNAIIGFATIAVSHLDNREQVRDCLQKVLSSSNHLLSLINDILDMSRIESGKMHLKEQECNISELMHNLVNIIQPQVKAKKLHLFTDTLEVTNEDVIADPLKLNQIFINILGNAVKYTQSGGRITFRIIQEPTFRHGYANYVFMVEDNGIGMSREFVEHIFEPFTRESTSTISGIQGTGLGMAITKNIIEMMNGVIKVESEPGKGSAFTVTLSLKLQKEKAEIPEIRKLAGKRVLIADDDFHVCVAVDKMLKKIGLRSEWTSSGREAVYRAEIARDEGDPFDTYILDWKMPDMNGVETARALRRVAGSEVSIIILTAYEWADIEDEARKAGVSGFCAKPLFMSDLKNTLLASHNLKHGQQDEGGEKPDFSGKRILLVDDLEMNREVAEFILSEHGFMVELATDGTDAVEMVSKAAENHYDAILMDVQMPTMNGYEATRAIRNLARNDVKTMPIIAMTANALEDDKAAALKSGMNAHIAKPIDIAKFFEVLKKFFGA